MFFFTPIENLSIPEKANLEMVLPKSTENLNKYTNNFLGCMRLRRKIIKAFHNFIHSYHKIESNFIGVNSMNNKKLISNYKEINNIGPTMNNVWIEAYINTFSSEKAQHESYENLLTNCFTKPLFGIIQDYRDENEKFVSNWNIKSKELKLMKDTLLGYINEKKELNGSIKLVQIEIEKNSFNNGLNSSNNFPTAQNKSPNSSLTQKLQQFQNSEQIIQRTIDNHNKLYKKKFIFYFDDLKNNVEIVRERELRSLTHFTHNLELIVMELDSK